MWLSESESVQLNAMCTVISDKGNIEIGEGSYYLLLGSSKLLLKPKTFNEVGEN